MTTVRAHLIGDKALIPRDQLDRLIELADRAEHVVLEIDEEDVPTVGLARLAEQGGSFDFWCENGEEIYSVMMGSPFDTTAALPWRYRVDSLSVSI